MTESTQSNKQPKLWMRPAVSVSVAAVVLIVGYSDLMRGGLTISAAMLTVGYLICVPIAIMAVPTAVPRPAHRANKLR